MPPINPLYGQSGEEGVSRFNVAGDLRRMYPVGAAGGLLSIEQLLQKTQSGSAFSYFVGTGTDLPSLATTDVFGSQNLISNGSALYGIGAIANVDSVVRALRLGVTGTTGGNDALAHARWGTIVTTEVAGSTYNRTFFYNGEAVYQDTNATTSTIGASVEAFVTNVAGTVTVPTAGDPSLVTGVGTTFTTASRTGAPYGAYHGSQPSKTLLQAGDLILITLDSGSKSLHRILQVQDATHLLISPNIPSAATAKAYVLYRSGYGSTSNVVSINDGSDNFYNYYAGAATAYGNGTINVFVRPAAGGTSNHFTAPLTTAGGANIAELQATDIAYYKSYLLYGNRGSISWSKVGFPTSFTTGFGADDFPSGNISVIDNEDTFVAFAYLGDQLIALFENSLWQVNPTGTVPEFNFFKLPEPVGVLIRQGGLTTRSVCSGRNAIFYWSNGGLMMLTGSTARNVSMDIFTALQRNFTFPPALTWEPTTNSVLVTTGNSSATGFIYNVETDTWSYLKTTVLGATTPLAITGNGKPISPQLAIIFYDATAERIQWLDPTQGGPYLPGLIGASNQDCIWATPIIGLGDDPDGFQLAGFQVDGIFGSNTTTWQMWAGRTPYAMEIVQTGTVEFIDDRRLLGKKVTAAFIAFVFESIGINRPIINGVNLYPEGRGK